MSIRQHSPRGFRPLAYRTAVTSTITLSIALIGACASSGASTYPSPSTQSDMPRPTQSLAVPVHELPPASAPPTSSGKGAPLTFAEPMSVSLSTENSGLWSVWDESSDRWRLDLRSPGARSINLHFDQLTLPPGAVLRLYAPSQPNAGVALTAADNKPHGEFWTPQIAGETLRIDLVLPTPFTRQVAMHIATVNVAW